MHLTDCRMKVDFLDYRRLPDQNPLFLDLLYDFDKISAFYSGAHLSPARLRRRAEDLLKGGRSYPRAELAPVLEDFNRRTGAGDRTQDQIQKLQSPDTVAIVTGQQLGLFGGPSYTVYKAATAIRLAEALEKEGLPAVAVFWLPSDDSDFQEVRSSTWLNAAGEAFQVEYPEEPASAHMVGPTPLARVGDCLEKLREKGLPGQFGDEVLRSLSQCYPADGDFRLGFARWLSSLFSDRGLILFDSLSSGYKQLVRPAFEKAVQQRDKIVAALQRRQDELSSSGYPAQVHVDQGESLLFWVDGEQRFKLRFENGRYQAKGARRSFAVEDLQNLLRDCPDCISPNVLLRPIIQDHLFPTAVYVGGPAEISYFSQINAIAGIWEIEPAVFPRAGLTIVDRKAQRLLDRYQLSPDDLLRASRLEVNRQIVEAGESARILEEFNTLEGEVERRLLTMEPLIRAEDPPVADMLQGAGQKILHQIRKVHDRYVKNHENRNAHLGNHLDYLYSSLLPDSKLQERVINFNHFLALEGKGILNGLLDSIDPFAPGHHVVWV